MISARTKIDSGVVSAGLITTVLPAASAGAIFQAAISSGKFQGMTWPATPAVVARVPGRDVAACRPSQRDRRSAASGGHVEVPGFLDRLAVVEGLHNGQLAGPFGDPARDPEEILATLGSRHRRPTSW